MVKSNLAIPKLKKAPSLSTPSKKHPLSNIPRIKRNPETKSYAQSARKYLSNIPSQAKIKAPSTQTTIKQIQKKSPIYDDWSKKTYIPTLPTMKSS